MKAIGGSGSKNPCWVYLKDLHEGEQRLFTECQNSAAFRSYCILKFAILVGSLIKKLKKVKFCDISRQTYQDLQFLLKLAEIWTRCSHHIGEQSQESFFENFENWRFYANFSRKMAWKWLFLDQFSWKIGIKPPIFKIFKKALSALFHYMVGTSGANFS